MGGLTKLLTKGVGKGGRRKVVSSLKEKTKAEEAPKDPTLASLVRRGLISKGDAKMIRNLKKVKKTEVPSLLEDGLINKHEAAIILQGKTKRPSSPDVPLTLKERAKTAVGRPTLKPEQKGTEKLSQTQKSVKAFGRRKVIKGAAIGTAATGAVVAGKEFLDSLSSEDRTSFKKAFAKAREKAKKKGDADEGVFSWRGDKFTTEVKKKGGGKVLYRDKGGQTHAERTKEHQSHKRKGRKAPRHPHVGRLKSKAIQDRIEASARRLPLNKKKPILTAAGNVIKDIATDPLSLIPVVGGTAALAKSFAKSRNKSPPKPKRKPTVSKKKYGGKIMKKKHGGMTHVGLSPAEEARAGTMSEAKRARYMQAGGPIRTTFPERADPRKGRKTAVDLFPEVGRKKGKKVGKKEQGYKAREDESVAMRVKKNKKRTKKKLAESRDESYGKWGTGKGKGKINRVSSKQTDGSKLIASLYDTHSG